MKIENKEFFDLKHEKNSSSSSDKEESKNDSKTGSDRLGLLNKSEAETNKLSLIQSNDTNRLSSPSSPR